MIHMKKIIVALTVLGLALLMSGPLSAQPTAPDPGIQQNGSGVGGPAINGEGPSAPLSGGAGILVAFGIAYAISRYNTKKKEA
jgi:hypothetical protein